MLQQPDPLKAQPEPGPNFWRGLVVALVLSAALAFGATCVISRLLF